MITADAKRDYFDLDENMDDSASANERFEVDSIDGSELDSVDSGSIITARADTGSTKRKGKKPHRGAASRRKVAQKPGKGNKGKGSIHASTKGKGRRSIFKKSVSKGI